MIEYTTIETHKLIELTDEELLAYVKFILVWNYFEKIPSYEISKMFLTKKQLEIALNMFKIITTKGGN